MFETVHVGCHVFFHALLNLNSGIVLGMNWLHAINPLTNWHAYLLYMVCVGETVRTVGTKYSCSYAFVKVCVLKVVLKTMRCDEVSAWYGALPLYTAFPLLGATFKDKAA